MPTKKKPVRSVSDSGPTHAVLRKGKPNPVPLVPAEENTKGVVIEGITLDGILREMQVAYQMVRPANTNDPVGIRRWRKLFLSKPERFMAILEQQERKFAARQAAAKAVEEELASLRARVPELEGGLTAALLRVGELEKLVPAAGSDEYENPAMGRLEELEMRLLREAKQ
jgi:hypothetical protein